jgi:leucyl/phenylalanyl-tRNA--protein transferase
MTVELPPSRFFPPAQFADPEGLLGIGGRLSTEWLLDAYSHGIFPWPHCDPTAPMLWWSPDPRAVLELNALRVSRRLRQTVRSPQFEATCDEAFPDVIRGCATAPGRAGHTWLTKGMIAAYIRLYKAGYAHSIEVWHEGQLAGGTYGVAIAGLFAAESMFFRVRDASKVALVYLTAHLRRRGYRLLDIQQLTPHTERLGAIEIPRDKYLVRLAEAVAAPVTFGERLETEGVER